MPKTVRIYGMARNLKRTPPPEKGEEVWLSNNEHGYQIRLPRALGEWTTWFNLHSRAWIDSTYRKKSQWYIDNANGRPVYMLKSWPDIPTSIEFPGKKIQEYFATKKGPNRYFTCSVCWLIAFAIMEGYERIELWGFALTDKPDKNRKNECYKYERPCFFYWVKQAQDRGIEVVWQKEVDNYPFEPGDPDAWDGPLYGYETKPEE